MICCGQIAIRVRDICSDTVRVMPRLNRGEKFFIAKFTHQGMLAEVRTGVAVALKSFDLGDR